VFEEEISVLGRRHELTVGLHKSFDIFGREPFDSLGFTALPLGARWPRYTGKETV
jgi:hypothetical protein